jgi:hypothetical protein
MLSRFRRSVSVGNKLVGYFRAQEIREIGSIALSSSYSEMMCVAHAAAASRMCLEMISFISLTCARFSEAVLLACNAVVFAVFAAAEAEAVTVGMRYSQSRYPPATMATIKRRVFIDHQIPSQPSGGDVLGEANRSLHQSRA